MLNIDITAKGIAYDLYTEGKIQHYRVSAEGVRAEIRPNYWGGNRRDKRRRERRPDLHHV